MNEPGQGPDPLAAARNVDQAAKTAVGEAIGQQDDRRNDPAPRFKNHTQALIGTLMAEEEKFKRSDLDLQTREQEAERVRNDAGAAAHAAYTAAVKLIDAAYSETTFQIERERIDLDNAREGIRAIVGHLTK
jgi:hypothetical protein